MEAGDEFLTERLEDGRENICSEFTELGFLNTRVDFIESYDRADNAIDVRVVIEPGPFTLVQVRGYDLDDSSIRDLIPVFEEGSVDPDLIEEGRVGLLEYVRQEGFFEASVAAELIAALATTRFRSIIWSVQARDTLSAR